MRRASRSVIQNSYDLPPAIREGKSHQRAEGRSLQSRREAPRISRTLGIARSTVVAPVSPRREAIGVEVQETPTTDADLVLDLGVRDGLVAGGTGAPASLANPLARLGGQRKESRRNLGPDPRGDVPHWNAPTFARGVPALASGRVTQLKYSESQGQIVDRPTSHLEARPRETVTRLSMSAAVVSERGCPCEPRGPPDPPNESPVLDK
jgi:hypothetical protein